MEKTTLNILVLGMGSNVSQGIVKALRNIKDLPINIIGACIKTSSVGLYLCDEAYISPLAADNSFVSWYINTCNNKKIDIVFTGVEENIRVLLQNRKYVENNTNSVFIFPNDTVWKIGNDKYYTCQWLKDNGLPYPEFSLASDKSGVSELITKIGFPLIAKPRSGKSSHGIITANSSNELDDIIGSDEYVVQELIGSDENEYTVGCYFSKKSFLQSKIIMHRYLKNGGTSMAEIDNNERIAEIVDKIAKNIEMSGPLNLQFRLREDGTPVCFEWNVRYSGATAIRSHFGFCDVEAAIREYVLNQDISECFHIADSGVAIRMDEEIYFDKTNFNTLFQERIL